MVIGSPEVSGDGVELFLRWSGRSGDNHPCENCKCCACHRLCTKCKDNCSPMESELIPVVYCPDFTDIRTLPPVRYLYRSNYGCEYRLRLPGTR